MSIKIESDHFIFECRNKVQQLSEDFFARHGFNFFQFLRCYADGSVNLLVNKSDFFEQFLQLDNTPIVFSNFSEQYENAHSYWFLWEEELPEILVEIAHYHKLYHGLTWLRRSKNYYDMVAVAMPRPIGCANSFYLNKMKVIEQFILEFEINHRDLIVLMRKHAIALPPSSRDSNCKKICLVDGKLTLEGLRGRTYITTTELDCLRYYLQGSPIESISQLLNLSEKNVIAHINNFQIRSGLQTRLQILNAFETLSPVGVETASAYPPGVNAKLKTFLQHKLPLTSDKNLTERELLVLQYTLHGKTAKKIAMSINLSFRTIEKYLESIKRKLNVNSKSELIELIIGE